jgi:hypothetical protein
MKLQLRRERRDAADTHKHWACDNLCKVRIERQQDSNSKEEAGNRGTATTSQRTLEHNDA